MMKVLSSTMKYYESITKYYETIWNYSESAVKHCESIMEVLWKCYEDQGKYYYESAMKYYESAMKYYESTMLLLINVVIIIVARTIIVTSHDYHVMTFTWITTWRNWLWPSVNYLKVLLYSLILEGTLICFGIRSHENLHEWIARSACRTAVLEGLRGRSSIGPFRPANNGSRRGAGRECFLVNLGFG